MQAYEQHVPLTTHSLKRTSRSPSPQPHKRRPPPNYAPAIYADLPPAGPPRSLSTEAIAGSPAPAAPPSGRSTPGDWLQRTRDLHLQTPTYRTPALEDDAMQSDDVGTDLRSGGAAFEDPDHIMLQDDEPSSPRSFYAPQPAVPLPSRSHASASPFWAPLPPASAAPHDAPPLHQHLAGSPQPCLASSSGDGAGDGGMARSASGGSVRSMGSAAACGAEADLLAHAHTHGATSSSSPRKASTPMPGTLGGRGGGWKVTMGYRADCERCLRQEQGHSTHVVWSS